MILEIHLKLLLGKYWLKKINRMTDTYSIKKLDKDANF